jgi:hypothetical protein
LQETSAQKDYSKNRSRFAIVGRRAYIQAMPKFIELPPAVARRFVEDMRAFHAESNAIKRDEVAARQLHTLRQHYTGSCG